MSGTGDLRSEHAGVGLMLDIMDAMAAYAQRDQMLDRDDLAQVIEFLRVFVDKCHHTKEEELLFPAISAAKMTTTEETIVVLLADHRRGRETVTRIAGSAQRLAEGDASAYRELAEALDAYTRLLRAHIRREEDDCFDAADRQLATVVQKELADGYERIEHDVVGEGRHEAFHALIERLGQVYRA